MKDLFRNHFPFVEQPAEGLTKEQKLIKQTYDKFYPTDSVPFDPDSKERIRQNTISKTKADRLREVHNDESPSTGAGE